MNTNMNTTRPTPETDAESINGAHHPQFVLSDFARKLERERDEAREQIQAMREVIAAAEKCRHWHDCSYNEDTGKTEGVIISAESFWSLQNALAKLQPFLAMNTTTPPPTQPTVQDVNPTNLQIEIGENVVALLKCPLPVAELAGMIDHIQTAYGPDLRFMEKPKGWLQIFKP